MNDTETNFDEAASETKPRKSRKRNDERRVFYYQTINGKPKELGSFPETAIGTLSERNITMFAKDFFREGEIRAEIRKSNGHFERSFDFSIAETEKPSQTAIEIDPEEYEIEPEEFSFDANEGQMNKLEVENLILKERLKRVEEDASRHKSGNQSEMQTLITALEDSRREQRELLMLMITQASKPQQPQQDPTTLMLSMLKGTLEVQRGVRELSEEIAPNDSGGGSLLSDGALLLNSIGNNAGKILPMITGALGGNRQAVRPTAPTNGANGNGQSGELSDLLSKVKTKKEVEKQ